MATTVKGKVKIKNLDIEGGFFVNGSTSDINTDTVNIKDNIITLNSGETSNKISKGKAGLEFSRGTSTAYQIVYDEADGELKAGLSNALKPIASQEYVNTTIAHLDMKGATEEEDGERGMVPKPSAGDNEKFLRGDGTWASGVTKVSLLNMVYPVGSIYISVNSTNPGELFGGTWEEMPAGRVLLAQGTSEWETTYTAGETGGEATHTLTTDEMPSHTHTGSTASAGEHTHGI